MVLGALLDAGLPLEDLTRALGSLTLDGYAVSAERVLRAGVSATKFRVHELPAASDRQHPTASVPEHPTASAPEHPTASAQEHPTTSVPHSHEHGHHHPHAHPHRSLPEIFRLIDRSALTGKGRDRARQMFERLAEAEAAIHQMPVEQVHLHE